MKMIERKTLVSVLLIVTLAYAVGYAVGRFSTPEERITTTTNSTGTATQTTMSTTTITETVTKTNTSTTTIIREPPQILPPPANSTAVIRGRYLLNGSVFATLSIDKPAYSPGEIVHIKATITNITPDDLSLELINSLPKIENISRWAVWMYPEHMFAGGLGAIIEYDFHLSPGETLTLDHMTVDWNQVGLHVVTTELPGSFKLTVYHDDNPVPEGQYTLLWPAYIKYYRGDGESINEKIDFTIK